MVLSEALKRSLPFIDVTARLFNVNAKNVAHPLMDTVVCLCCMSSCMSYCMCLCLRVVLMHSSVYVLVVQLQ